MARTYATIDAGIWLDPEFCALTAGAQRTYFMLITQSDISAAGTLPLTLRRWAKTCSEKDLTIWLAELTDHAFVLLDEDTEELLVRTFVKWDGGYKHSKRVLAVIANARALRSSTLRDTAVDELAKLGVSIANGIPPDRDSDGMAEANDSRRSVVTEVGNESTPHSSIQEREPSPPETGATPSMFCSKHPNGTDKPCGPCGSARAKAAGWSKQQQRRLESEVAALAAARAACDMCDDKGMVLDANRKPISKCNHRRSA